MSTGPNTLTSSGPAVPNFEEQLDPLGRVEVPLESQVPELTSQLLHDQAEAALKHPRE